MKDKSNKPNLTPIMCALICFLFFALGGFWGRVTAAQTSPEENSSSTYDSKVEPTTKLRPNPFEEVRVENDNDIQSGNLKYEFPDDFEFKDIKSNFIFFREGHCGVPGTNCDSSYVDTIHTLDDVSEKQINGFLKISMGPNNDCKSVKYQLLYLAVPTYGRGNFFGVRPVPKGSIIGNVFKAKTLAFGMRSTDTSLGPWFTGWVDINLFTSHPSCPN